MPTDTTPKSRPIIFTGQSVAAIIEGGKSQTRRLCKDQGDDLVWEYLQNEVTVPISYKRYTGWAVKYPNQPLWLPRKCPYTAGQLLWVKETWGYSASGPKMIVYKAGGEDQQTMDGWHSPWFMKRIHSRLTLEVVEVKPPERVGEISEADAYAEGSRTWRYGEYPVQEYSDVFRDRWDTLHAKPKPVRRGGKIVRYESFPWGWGNQRRWHRDRPWTIRSNPWVWPVRFKAVERGKQ